MVESDEHTVLVIMKSHTVKTIIDLGYANLQSFELDRLSTLVEPRGYQLYLTTMEDVRQRFSSIYNLVQEITK